MQLEFFVCVFFLCNYLNCQNFKHRITGEDTYVMTSYDSCSSYTNGGEFLLNVCCDDLTLHAKSVII